jgi:hypothetical protein
MIPRWPLKFLLTTGETDLGVIVKVSLPIPPYMDRNIPGFVDKTMISSSPASPVTARLAMLMYLTESPPPKINPFLTTYLSFRSAPGKQE